MIKERHAEYVCQICQQKYKKDEVLYGGIIRRPLVNLIKKKYPEWADDKYICINDLNKFRLHYVESVLADEQGELSTIEREVAESLIKHETISENLVEVTERSLTFGQRLSDSISQIGGSWGFIISFAVFLLVWMLINSLLLLNRSFDPYPYILLNLVLSTLAAIQAPVIMMSQRRQEVRDRLRAENDYRVNLKSELEIRQLHEKIDHVLNSQWQRLMDIQEIQIDLIQEIKKAGDK
jgi:uncharacterized membrane protein